MREGDNDPSVCMPVELMSIGLSLQFAKERRSADVLAKHYAQQDEDASRLTAENRRLLDKLQERRHTRL